MVVEHVLKCWPVYYDAIVRGEKPFEVRRDDRGYQKGDYLLLRRYELGRGYDTTSAIPLKYVETRRRISYVLTGGQLGIEPGYVVLGLESPTPPEVQT